MPTDFFNGETYLTELFLHDCKTSQSNVCDEAISDNNNQKVQKKKKLTQKCLIVTFEFLAFFLLAFFSTENLHFECHPSKVEYHLNIF